jgi:hypothetical protein
VHGWVQFDRRDATVVIDMVRRVATAHDPGEHGEGVEVVIEAPKPGFFAGLFGDHRPDQARIAVTRPGGEVRYPIHIQLVTDHGGRAAHRLPRLPGWATSNSAGLAFLMRKAEPGYQGRHCQYDWATLVGGAVAAISVLRPDAADRGWRATVDRSVRRN